MLPADDSRPDQLSRPDRAPQAATCRTGLGEKSLQQAIHDLRGPLNTIAILTEVLRPQTDDQVVQGLLRAMQQFRTMLDRLHNVSGSIAGPLRPMDLAAHIRLACDRAVPAPAVSLHVDAPAATTVLSSPQHLDAALDTLLACGTGALPDGGTIALALARIEAAQPDQWQLRMRCEGPRILAPTPRMMARLHADPDERADWFRLTCQVEGLGASLHAEQGTHFLEIVMQRENA